MNPGKLIAFEGIDGCGKSTQLAKLAERVRAADIEVCITAEPTPAAIAAAAIYCGRLVGLPIITSKERIEFAVRTDQRRFEMRVQSGGELQAWFTAFEQAGNYTFWVSFCFVGQPLSVLLYYARPDVVLS